MINHYLNLIKIDEWISLRDDANFYCDSISFKVALKLLGINAQLKPGSSTIELIQKNKENSLFLISKPNDEFQNSIVLPQFNHFEDISDELMSEIKKKLVSSDLVFIGVSSPKQNFFAEYLAELQNKKTFYCVGAVLDNNSYGLSAIKLTSGSGLEWLVNSIIKPRRTFKKFFTIALFFVKISLYKNYRHKLKEGLSGKF